MLNSICNEIYMGEQIVIPQCGNNLWFTADAIVASHKPWINNLQVADAVNNVLTDVCQEPPEEAKQSWTVTNNWLNTITIPEKCSDYREAFVKKHETLRDISVGDLCTIEILTHRIEMKSSHRWLRHSFTYRTEPEAWQSGRWKFIWW